MIVRKIPNHLLRSVVYLDGRLHWLDDTEYCTGTDALGRHVGNWQGSKYQRAQIVWQLHGNGPAKLRRRDGDLTNDRIGNLLPTGATTGIVGATRRPDGTFDMFDVVDRNLYLGNYPNASDLLNARIQHVRLPR